VDAAARERAEKHGECGHESLTLAGGHLGDFALMKHDAADELHAIVHHVPGDFVAAGHPAVLPDGIVAVDAHKFAALACEFAVESGCFDYDGVAFGEAFGRLAHSCENYGQMVVELLLENVKNAFFVSVNLIPEWLALVEGQSLYVYAEFVYRSAVFCGSVGYGCAHFIDFVAEAVVIEGGYAGHFSF